MSVIVPESCMTLQERKKQFYVNREDLLAEIKSYYLTDVFSNKLGHMILLIAQGLRYKPNFINYTYKDDMISDAVFNMCKAIKNKNFDFNKVKCTNEACGQMITLIPPEGERFAKIEKMECPFCHQIMTPMQYSPFSYLTQIASFAFINRIKTEDKNNTKSTEYKQRLYEEIMINNPEFNIYVKNMPCSNNIDGDE